jgi:hypothetical protein
MRKKPHGYWRFPCSRLLQLFPPFRMNSTNFELKQTPKSPNQKAHECEGVPSKASWVSFSGGAAFPYARRNAIVLSA